MQNGVTLPIASAPSAPPDVLPLPLADAPAPAVALDPVAGRLGECVPSTPSAPAPAPATLLMSARQCAAQCGVSVATWWRWDSAGRCPAAVLRERQTVRWRREDLLRWIALGCPS